MQKTLAALAAALLAVLVLATPAGAQDPVIGTVSSDPATVPEAGEHTVTASGSGFLPDSTLLLGSCRAPGDELVPGVSSTEEITAAAQSIDPLVNCDVAGAQQVTTDGDGNFSMDVTATIGPNFFLTAGTLDQAQSGAVWIPIVDPDAAALAVTGAEHWATAGFGIAMVLLGAFAVFGSRRLAIR